jgi:PAS domain S-box-containing protein
MVINEPSQLKIQTLLGKQPFLKQVLENIKQMVWIYDLITDRVAYANPAFESVWGCSCESLYKDPLILIKSVHPEDRVKVISASPDDIRRSMNQTYRILRPDGTLRWISARTIVIQEDSSEVAFRVSIAEDITDQNQVDQTLHMALDRSREQFTLSRRMSLARKTDAVLNALMSAEGLRSAQRSTLLFFENPKVGPARGVDVTSYWLSSQILLPWLSESNLYEEPAFWELLQPNSTLVITRIQSDPRLTPVVRDFLLEGQIQTLAIFPLVASGDWLGCLLVYYQSETQFDHLKLRHLKVLVDQATITLYNLHLLKVEEESRLEAERANEIKTKFLAMISHELRTPLTSIIGFTTTLLADDVAWEPDEQRDFIQTIQQEANRLHELIDHLLDLSRLDAGMLPISLEPHSIYEIIEDASPQFQILTSGHNLMLHLPDNLPLVFVDAKRISQVLVNLVRNAATYAPQGTNIDISASPRGGFLQINVTDHGPGIHPSEYKKVFQAFRRGTALENGAIKGAGLGLAICKGLVEAHGGRIWIKKKHTPGATFSFTIQFVAVQKVEQPEIEEH